MLSNLLATTVHLAPATGGSAAASSDVWQSVLTVLAVIGIICVLLIVLTYLEPKRATAGSPSEPVVIRDERARPVAADSSRTRLAAALPGDGRTTNAL